jgi:hypothetical protein
VLGKGIVERELLFDFAALGTAVSHSLFVFWTCSVSEGGMDFRLFVVPLDILFVF